MPIMFGNLCKNATSYITMLIRLKKVNKLKKLLRMVLWIIPLFFVLYFIGYTSDFPGSGSPLHASCKIEWSWPNNKCPDIQQKLLAQISEWTGECDGIGQKCLYKLVEQTPELIKATHTTPIKRYVDTLMFTFSEGTGVKEGCNVFVITIIFMISL